MLRLPDSALRAALGNSVAAGARTGKLVAAQPPMKIGEALSFRSAMRRAIDEQTGTFTNADILSSMMVIYPGRFRANQAGSVSSVMAKFGHKELVRQVTTGAGRGGVVVWEKTDKWVESHGRR